MNTPAAVKATRREWIGLGVIALPCMLYSMDLTVLNLALPALAAELAPSAVELLWIVDIYGFLVAGALITMGTLGDRIGRRRLLMIGAAVFGVASIVAAFSTSPEMLIATRAALGIAGATLAPSTFSLIRNMFHDPRERTVAISVWITSYSAGAAIGPLLGGALLAYFWWGSVFLLAVPVMLLLLALGPSLLPEYRDPDAGRIDLASAALSLAAVLTLIFGLKQAAQHGFSALAVVAILTATGLAALFVHRQARLPDPLIDLRLFRTPAFSASLAVYMLGTFVAFGIFVFMTQYLLLALQMTPLEAGLWTVPFALGFIAGSMVAPRLVRALRPADVMAGGLALAALGFLLITQAGRVDGPGLVVAGMVLQAIGLAPVFTLTNDLIMSAAPPERAGAASGISETSSELGGALGIALLGSLATAVYGAALDRATITHTLELTAAVCAALTAAMVAAIVVLLRPVGAAA
ncbi:MAG TPA: MFS transporter [Burkholderiales bacterium]|nr:MFS transporter [Burkholderiales bacterium]